MEAVHVLLKLHRARLMFKALYNLVHSDVLFVVLPVVFQGVQSIILME
jgi:hypothetical protein